ncbi:MAG: hypothetical protein ISR62_03015 [Desulfobacteraceae bacterium]|nr:hypothetical protein [Desulfobacterales bacterium]MBL6967374.1 hypothetical protein [Desulfobacteraceae bacterium]MBL7173163.1 hypothetical protein [Desulfobacteraceae bacterium]MBU0735873.1 hypothetical protein [Pseudomonadota bacterium]MBU1932257.1 hypothetical protein [Patescibacteria group bacterium]
MIDQEIKKIANDRIRIEIGEQNTRLSSEIERIKAEMNDRGVLRSGMTISRIVGLCIDTIKMRGQLVWQTLFRFITTAGISYSSELADELKDLVAQHLPEGLADLRGYVEQTAKLAGSQTPPEEFVQRLGMGRSQAIKKVGTEIDLFVHSLKRKAEAEKDGSASTVFNIYSPVGSIQTGDNSIANVSMNIDTEIKEQIRKTLEEINSTLMQPEIETPTPKNELIEVVQESQEELQRVKPNVTRLKSLLTTVGTSSSLKPQTRLRDPKTSTNVYRHLITMTYIQKSLWELWNWGQTKRVEFELGPSQVVDDTDITCIIREYFDH